MSHRNNTSPLQTVMRTFSQASLRLSILLLLMLSAASLAQNTTPARPDQGPEFLYVIENPDTASSIEAFQIDTSTGALTPLSTPTALTRHANDIVADRKSKFLFVGESSSCCFQGIPSVKSFGIKASGSLTLAGEITLPNNHDTLLGLALDHSGTDLYASSEIIQSGGTVSSFSVDRGTGALSVLSPDPGTNFLPGRLLVHPNGQFVYATILTPHHRGPQGGYDLYLRDPETGTLTYANKQFRKSVFIAYGASTFALRGRFLVGTGQGEVTVFSVNQDTGELTVASSLPGDFRGVAADRTGSFIVLAGGDGSLTSYTVNDDGSLTPAGSATAVAGISNVVIDDSNKFVYVENPGSSQIFAYMFDAETGTLGSVAGSPFSTSGTPIRMATAAPHQ